MEKDHRLRKLAQNVLQNSVCLQPGEKIYIETSGTLTTDFLTVLIEETIRLGAVPFYYYNDTLLRNALLCNASERQIREHAKLHARIMEQMDAYVGIRCVDNPIDAAVPGMEQNTVFHRQYAKPVHFDIRIPKTKWCLLRYSTPVMAFQSNMSTEEFEDFYFSACLTDYRRMYTAMQPLVKLMEKTDKVRIVAPETDLSFSIKNIPVTACHGLRNIPDGEVYSAPVIDSVNGKIKFNTICPQNGRMFTGISLTFRNGKAVEAGADNYVDDLQKILDTDSGSRYTGEFAFGLNPFINRAVGDTLFDEKISGSVHLALGNFCGNACNGNRSGIHWDLVQIQTPEYGGGEIWFDDVLIRKDGLFVFPELQDLNP
mgnify:FL=1